MELWKIVCAQATRKTEDEHPPPLSKKLGLVFTYLSYFPLLYNGFAVGHWLNRANSPAIKYRNHPACTIAELPAVLRLKIELRMQPQLQSTVRRQDN